ncbi:glycosyltransferase family 4 protein [Ralstonia sp. 25C]|uniref:glycosyltransferase family 4 protein n=1 Tax=Ralstonia sp. 25C TaxID=3447363 RepID=UPI003F74CF13
MLAPVQRLGAGSVFFNVGHTGLHRESYVNWLGQSGLRPVFMVHDLIPITHPEYARDGERNRHERRIAAMLRLGSGLITNSRATLDALRAYARERGLAMPATTVAPLAGADLPVGDSVPLLDGPYFVMLGTVEPRKNHAMMLQIWREMAARGGPVPRLVLIGQRGWNVEHVYGLLDRCSELAQLVILRPDCGDAELATWLRHTRALLFPSFAEGYGMPLAEALAMGTPVIASDLDVFHEIAGSVPDYLSPLDGIGWRNAILDFASSASSRRGKQAGRIRNFRASGWDQHFASVDQLLAEVSGASHV